MVVCALRAPKACKAEPGVVVAFPPRCAPIGAARAMAGQSNQTFTPLGLRRGGCHRGTLMIASLRPVRDSSQEHRPRPCIAPMKMIESSKILFGRRWTGSST